MPTLLCPPVPTTLTIEDVERFEQRIDLATSDDMRACANCGIIAFGHEAHWANFRSAFRTPSNSRALALSPVIDAYGTSPHLGQPDNVLLCYSCRSKPACSLYRSRLTPTWCANYAEALALIDYRDLHGLSFVDISYKLTQHPYGYIRGEFDAHSLVHAPLLVREDALMVDRSVELELIYDRVTQDNMLFQLFTPVAFRSGTNLLELHGDAWLHIVHSHARRDPVTNRDHHDYRNIASLDVISENGSLSYTSHAVVGTIMSPSGIFKARMLSADVLYQTGLTTLRDGSRQSVEHLLFPTFFPDGVGFYTKPASNEVVGFTIAKYLQHRCLQGFTPFTKQTPYLLIMRSLENARAAVAHGHGGYTVNRATFEKTKADLCLRAERDQTPMPTTSQVLSTPSCLTLRCGDLGCAFERW